MRVEETASEEKPHRKGYTKNILGYEAKKAISLMFSTYSKQVSLRCRKQGISYRQFKKFYKAAEARITGPVELSKLFHVESTERKEEEVRSKRLFARLFSKILRKNYMIYSLKKGKMWQMEEYIRKKNEQLLYYGA